MALNPLEIKIAAIGGAQAKDALRDIGQAYQELARVQQLAAKTTEDAWSNSFQRMQRQFEEFNRALSKSNDKGPKAKSELEKSHEIASMSRGAWAWSKFLDGLDFVVGALKKFGTFLLNDIIMPSLKAGKAAAQLANTFEGASSKDVKSAMLGFREKYAGVDSDVIKQTFRIAGERTGGNLGHAKTITDLALKAGEAYGQDPTKIAEMLAVKRMALPQSISEDHFRQIAAAELMVGKSSGFGMTGMASAKGRITQMAKKLSGGVDEGTALHDVELTNMIAHGAINFGGKGANKAISGLNSLFKDLEREAPNLEREGIKVLGKSSLGTTKINDLSEIIPRLLQSVGGDVMKLGAGPKGGTTLGSMPLGKGFSSASVDALRAYGFTDVYQKAEQQKKGSGAEAVKKMIEEMAKPTGDAMKKLEEDFKKVDSEPIVQFEQAMRELKDTLAMAIMPTIRTVLIPTIQAVKPVFDDMIKWFREMLEKVKPDQIVKIFETVAKGIGAAFYHMLKMADKMGLTDIAKEDLEALRSAVGANKTSTATANVQDKFTDTTLGKVLMFGALGPVVGAGAWLQSKAVGALVGGNDNPEKPTSNVGTLPNQVQSTGNPFIDTVQAPGAVQQKDMQQLSGNLVTLNGSIQNLLQGGQMNRMLPMSSPIRADSGG